MPHFGNAGEPYEVEVYISAGFELFSAAEPFSCDPAGDIAGYQARTVAKSTNTMLW
jgi:hypothetical protein